MLSDEMTTGSVNSTDRDKRILASRSHEWNRNQKRFTEAFPEVRSSIQYHQHVWIADMVPIWRIVLRRADEESTEHGRKG
jgi:hypothetical protein